MIENAIDQTLSAPAGDPILQLNGLCRRVGLPTTSLSELCAKRIRDGGRENQLQLYDLIWSVRAAVWRLAPCATTRHGKDEVFRVEFWSLGASPEPELQRIDARLSTLPDGSKHLHLTLAEESTQAFPASE